MDTLSQQAEAGDAVAQYQLAQVYEAGRGVGQDIGRAIELYRRSAESGYGPAMIDLGWFHQNGMHGLAYDPGQALQLYARAADQGLAMAQLNLATMYDEGIGTIEDNTRAVALYRRAADAGNPRAQLNLGVMYWRGEGVPQDLTLAHRWLTLARLNDQDEQAQWAARGALDQLTPQLSSTQRKQNDAWFKASKAYAKAMTRAERAENRSQWAQAGEAYQQAIDLAREHDLGPSATSAALYNLGRVTGFDGRDAEAEQHLRGALALERQASGPESALVCMRLMELARLHVDHDRFVQAAEYFVQGVKLARQLGVTHDDPIGFARVLDDYARALHGLGEPGEAAAIAVEAEQLREAHPREKALFTPRRYR